MNAEPSDSPMLAPKVAQDKSRADFEAAISAPPYERSIERRPDDPTMSAWPGTYRDIAVDLAWHMWQVARAQQPVTPPEEA